jgi:hypothetical protein
MGTNPDSNVCDPWGTAGARNPTQTLQALAWRTAQHLVDEWDDITA